MCSPILSGCTRLTTPPDLTDWPGKFPSSLATHHLPAYDFRNRLATKLAKTFGGPFSRNMVSRTTGYASYPTPLSSQSGELSSRVVSLFNSRTSGRTRNKSNGCVIPIHSSGTGSSNPPKNTLQVGVYFTEVDHGEKIKYVPRSVQIDLEDGVLNRVSPPSVLILRFPPLTTNES